jgi:hypothetical protein
LRPAVAILVIFSTPYFFLPIYAAKAFGAFALLAFNLVVNALNLSPLPNFGFLFFIVIYIILTLQTLFYLLLILILVLIYLYVLQ